MSGAGHSVRRAGGWGWVLLAGLFEVGFTYALKMEAQDRSYLAMFLVCAVISFECLSQALKSLPVGLAYAVWTGIGSVGTIALGLLRFGESASVLRLGLLAVLVGCILALKMLDDKEKRA